MNNVVTIEKADMKTRLVRVRFAGDYCFSVLWTRERVDFYSDNGWENRKTNAIVTRASADERVERDRSFEEKKSKTEVEKNSEKRLQDPNFFTPIRMTMLRAITVIMSRMARDRNAFYQFFFFFFFGFVMTISVRINKPNPHRPDLRTAVHRYSTWSTRSDTFNESKYFRVFPRTVFPSHAVISPAFFLVRRRRSVVTLTIAGLDFFTAHVKSALDPSVHVDVFGICPVVLHFLP